MRSIAILLLLASAAQAAPEDVEYHQPFQYGEVRRVTCGNGHGSHTDGGNRYAVDYGMPIGTPVVAAESGRVLAVEERFSGPSPDAGKANQVAVRHANGQVTVYLHLKQDGAVVAVGDDVLRGDLIGYSGNSGRSSGPHLHFGVHARLGGGSVAFRYADFGGSGVPNYLDRVTSFNFPIRYETQYRAIERAVAAYALCRRLGCLEPSNELLEKAASLEMPMPLRVLEEMLRRRDAALTEFDESAVAALGAARAAWDAGDLATGVRIADFGVDDYPEYRESFRTLVAEMQRDPGYVEVAAGLRADRKYRQRLLLALRSELAGAEAKRTVEKYAAALKIAPAWARTSVESHLAALESGLNPSTVEYHQPWEYREIRLVLTGNGKDAHTLPSNRFAFDFRMPIGTPVVASAPGVVVAVKEDTLGPTGRSEDDNFLAIRHADGAVSEYRHLECRGVVVEVGDEVRRGDLVAYSGATGAATVETAHLHFGLRRGVDGVSIPVRFADFGGSNGVPQHGNLVTSFNTPDRHLAAIREIDETVQLYRMCKRFGCLEAVAPKLAAAREVRFTSPLRILATRTRRRDAVLREYDVAAQHALDALESATDFRTRVRLARFGAADFASAVPHAAFLAVVDELRGDKDYWNADRALDAERTYRRLVSLAAMSEIGGDEPREQTLRRYRRALEAAPEAHRADLLEHVKTLEAR